jgi:hypothetical protein
MVVVCAKQQENSKKAPNFYLPRVKVWKFEQHIPLITSSKLELCFDTFVELIRNPAI